MMSPCASVSRDDEQMQSIAVRGRRRAALTHVVVVGSTAMLVLVPDRLAQAAPSAAARPHRILIVSVPTLTWTDLDRRDAHLSRFLDRAAIADLATRADRQPAKLGAAYVTIGAGRVPRVTRPPTARASRPASASAPVRRRRLPTAHRRRRPGRHRRPRYRPHRGRQRRLLYERRPRRARRRAHDHGYTTGWSRTATACQPGRDRGPPATPAQPSARSWASMAA